MRHRDHDDFSGGYAENQGVGKTMQIAFAVAGFDLAVERRGVFDFRHGGAKGGQEADFQ